MSITTPDPLVDLTFFDVDAQGLIDQALTDAAAKFPGWVQREGNTEVVLVESQALLAAEIIFAINRVPGAVLDALLTEYGSIPDPGIAPTLSVTFFTTSAYVLTIPAGTEVLVPLSADASLTFATDVELVIAANDPSGTVACTADSATDLLNGNTPASVTLVDAIAAVDSLAAAGAVAGGVNPEDSAAFRTRGASVLRRMTSTLVLPEHFTAAAIEETTVLQAATFDLFNAPLGTGSPGSHPGHVTVAVVGAGGSNLSAGDKTALAATLEAKCHAALVVHVIDVTVTAVAVTCSVTLEPGASSATVIAAVTAALDAYLDPDSWPFAGTVYRNELIAVIDAVPGVGRVATLSVPAADVALTGTAPLANAGTLTVTTVA